MPGLFDPFLEEKLLRKRIIVGDCWLWDGSNNGNYGEMRINGKLWKTHILAAHVWLDFDLKDHESKHQVNHRPECKNKLCFNPAHLYIGSQGQNLRDKFDNNPTCRKGHLRTPANTIVSPYGRQCRECANEARRKRYKESKERNKI